jgi:hypothetical protein
MHWTISRASFGTTASDERFRSMTQMWCTRRIQRTAESPRFFSGVLGPPPLIRIVMRQHRFFIPSLTAAIIVALAVFMFCRGSYRPFRAKVVGTHWHEEALYVNLEFTNTGATCIGFAHSLEVQVRSGGKWHPAQKFELDRNPSWWGLPPSLESGESLPARIPCGPARAEACRVYLRYRGESLRWRAYSFLVGHDWFRKAPRLFGWLILRLPEHPKWQRSVLEFELPNETGSKTRSMHNLPLHWTGSSRFGLVPMGTSVAAAPGQ